MALEDSPISFSGFLGVPLFWRHGACGLWLLGHRVKGLARSQTIGSWKTLGFGVQGLGLQASGFRV